MNWRTGGYESDVKYLPSGTTADTASWTFTGLTPGSYEVSAHWFEHHNRATDAQYTIFDDAAPTAGPITKTSRSLKS